MRSLLLLLIGFPLLHVSSFGGETKAKADLKKSALPAAPHYWDSKSWEKGAATTFWRACPKNKSTTTPTVSDSMKHADNRTSGRKQSSPTKGG